MTSALSATGEAVAWLCLGIAIGCGPSAGAEADVDAMSSRWRDFWYCSHFVSEIHFGFCFAEARGLEELESDGEGWYWSWHGERPPFGGKNTADPLCGFSL
jgi:hypothetical protein